MLYDDRDERAGVKFKDADLIGIPFRIAIGKKGLAEGVVELKLRKGTEVRKIKLDEIVPLVVAEVTKERRRRHEGASHMMTKPAHDIAPRDRVIVACDVPDLAGARRRSSTASTGGRPSTRSGSSCSSPRASAPSRPCASAAGASSSTSSCTTSPRPSRAPCSRRAASRPSC